MRVRSEFDGDRIERNLPTDIENDINRFELDCSMCGRMQFVDQSTFDTYRRAIEEDLDNRFVCLDCESEFDELAFA